MTVLFFISFCILITVILFAFFEDGILLTNPGYWTTLVFFAISTAFLLKFSIAQRRKELKEEHCFKPILKNENYSDLKQSNITLPGTYIFFDLETTGLSCYDDKIIQIGAVKVVNGVIVDKFCEYVNPERSISSKITKITGITNSKVKYAPFLNEVLPKFKEFVGNDILVAHNAWFDISFINQAYRTVFFEPIFNKYIDTLQISRDVFPYMPNHKLETLICELQINERNSHDALADSKCVYQLFLQEYRALTNRSQSLHKYIENNSDIRISDLKPQCEINVDNPFYKKICVFHNYKENMNYVQKVINLGGYVRQKPSTKTNYFIIEDDCDLKKQKTSAIDKYFSALEKGADINVLTKSEFIKKISGYTPI